MYIDENLIAQAELLATGRYVHKVANLVAAYRTAYSLAKFTKDIHDIEIFHETQKDLRIFINRRRVEKIDPDEYDLDILS